MLRHSQQQNDKARQVLLRKEQLIIEQCIQMQNNEEQKGEVQGEGVKDLSSLDNKVQPLDFWFYLD